MRRKDDCFAMSRDYVSRMIQEMPPSGIRKFFDVAQSIEGIVSLGVGEPDFSTPWYASEAAIRSIEAGKTQYTSNQGMPVLREEIVKYLQEQFQVSYHPQDEVMITVGASEGIDLAMRAILEPGDEVLVPQPSYVSYCPCVTMAGGKPVPLRTMAEHQFRLQPEELEAAITPKTRAIILPYPNNPTGAIMEKEDLEKLVPILIQHDILVVSDEIYAELTYGRKHVSIASLPGMWERTILLNGFSKAFAMTGWRLGYAAAPRDILQAMNKIHQYIIMCAPTMSQYAALEALRNEMSREDVERMRDEYDVRRRLIVGGFRSMGLDCFEPLGAFYCFPCIQSTGMTSDEFCEALLWDSKVAVVPGTAFGDSGEGFIRCSYAYSEEEIQVALDRIEKFVRRKRGY